MNGGIYRMTCDEALARVYPYLDNEMAEAGCAAIREHLRGCGSCLRAYGVEEAVKRLVAEHCGSVPAPPGLRGKVLARIRETLAGMNQA